MKTTPFVKIVSVTILSFLLVTCSKPAKQNVGTTTVAQDKQFISNTVNESFGCVEAVKNGGLAQSVITFLSLSNGTIGNENWVDSLTNSLNTAMGTFQVESNGHFAYNSYCGIYQWNSSTQTFTKTNSTQIIIQFPSSPSSTSNDVTITLSQYTDNAFYTNTQTVYLPTSAVGTITQNGTTLATLNYTGTYSTGNFPTPISVVCSLSIAPHNYSLNVTQINSTQFHVTSNLINGDGCGSSVDATVYFNNDDYNDFDISKDLNKVTGTFTNSGFSINASWDATTFYALGGNADAPTLNSSLSATVYNTGNKIGALSWVAPGGQLALNINYKDTTSDNTSIYYNVFETNVKDMLRPYFGNSVDDYGKNGSNTGNAGKSVLTKDIYKITAAINKWLYPNG